MDRLERAFLALGTFLETHLACQEDWLFPRLRELDEGENRPAGTGPESDSLPKALDGAKRASHEALGMMDDIQDCLRDPQWVGEGPLVEQLIRELNQLRRELAAYARLEAEVLVSPADPRPCV
jgi:hypothetical protein